MARLCSGILVKNGIEWVLFADAVVTFMALGSGNGRNIYITGPANYGKPFFLDPLRIIFNTFPSPANCSYAWLGVEERKSFF